MRRVTVVCVASDKAATVERLAALGVVHLQPLQAATGHGVHAAGAHAAGVPAVGVDAARGEVERIRAALTVLAPRAAPISSGGQISSGGSASDAAATVTRALALHDEQRALEVELAQLDDEARDLMPWGDFDPASPGSLGAHGVSFTLCRYPSRDPPKLPANATCHPITTTDGTTHAVVIAHGPCDLALDARPWPARSLREVQQAQRERRARLAAVENELAMLAGERAAVERLAVAAAERLDLAEAVAGMRDDAPLAWLQGFCPRDAVAAVHAAGQAAGWAVRDDEPDASDPVPTLLRGARWVRPVHAVLTAIGVTPGYGEPDVSPVFLLFLLLFSGMLIGDAGYGVLLIGAMVGLRLARPHLPRQFLNLTTSIGVASLAWGTITGTWFGLPVIPAALDGLRIEWLAGQDKLATTRNVMLLCFLLGATHLTVAHLWAAARARGLGALAQLGWIASTWTMFFAARTMVLGEAFPPVMLPIAAVGVGMVALFMTPPRLLPSEWFNHVMLPLTLVSNFVDVVSYLRLFAVGTASVAVAGAFNAMAAKAAADGGLGVVLAVGIALFGHTLNLALCAMGVLVHGVRLNTLEFSAHVGLQWSGTAYRPLRRRFDAGPETNLTS